MPIRIAMIAAECEPWAKTGGLADVVDALARALGRLPEAATGELVGPVDVFLPRYRSVQLPPDVTPQEQRVGVADPLASAGATEVRVISVVANGYRLRLVDHPPAFDRDGLYGPPGADYPDNAWRFGLFCRAALAAMRADGWPPDILHVHDWHTGPAVIDVDRGVATGDQFFRDTGVVTTIHNLAYHGWTPAGELRQLGYRPGDGVVAAKADGLDLLREAIARADLVNTVSPGFAREALTAEYGMGLDGLLRARGERFIGILNGIDRDVWNPAMDPEIAASYDRDDRSGKDACRRDLAERVGFDADDAGPILGMIGRLDRQKGFDLLSDAAPAILSAGGRIVVQGSGDRSFAEPFRALATKHPRSVALIERFDRAMARRIYAGADFFLMPSRFEPCGQGQMISLRYGTPPIARRTGGLGDSIVDADEAPDGGTGFLFDEAAPDVLAAACVRAMRLRSDPGRWKPLLDRGMAVDFGWDTGSAPRYLVAYRRAIEIARSGRRRHARASASASTRAPTTSPPTTSAPPGARRRS